MSAPCIIDGCLAPATGSRFGMCVCHDDQYAKGYAQDGKWHLSLGGRGKPIGECRIAGCSRPDAMASDLCLEHFNAPTEPPTAFPWLTFGELEWLRDLLNSVQEDDLPEPAGFMLSAMRTRSQLLQKIDRSIGRFWELIALNQKIAADAEKANADSQRTICEDGAWAFLESGGQP